MKRSRILEEVLKGRIRHHKLILTVSCSRYPVFARYLRISVVSGCQPSEYIRTQYNLINPRNHSSLFFALLPFSRDLGVASEKVYFEWDESMSSRLIERQYMFAY